MAVPEIVPTSATSPSLEGQIPHASTWDHPDWENVFSQFTRACHLTVSLYDENGVRRIGPIQNHPLAHLMEEAGAWENGTCERYERLLVKEVLSSRQPLTNHFEDSLLVHGFPLESQDTLTGVLVVGWTFDQFADPIRCARLARKLKISENVFWMAAREVSPTSREKFSTYISLLKTMVQAIQGQLSVLGEIKMANRIKDQFLATASHELKTPLTSMQLRVQILRRTANLSKDQLMQGLEMIERGIRTQTKLVDDLLESSRVSTGKLKLEIAPINPEELVQNAVDTATPAAEAKGVQLTLEILPLQLRYDGDAIRLQQVYWNLLNNAVKFTPAGGFVAVWAKEVKGNLVVEVRDSGKGIDPVFLPRLFEPFFQVRNLKDEKNSGLGLGLSVAKAVIDLHGGSLKVESAGLNRGATFTVSLPSIYRPGTLAPVHH